MYIDLLPGGAVVSVTTVPTSIDVSLYRGMFVGIWSDDVDFYLVACPTAETSPSLMLLHPYPATAPNLVTMLPERIGKGTRIERRLTKYTHLAFAAVKGKGDICIKPLGGPPFGGVSV